MGKICLNCSHSKGSYWTQTASHIVVKDTHGACCDKVRTSLFVVDRGQIPAALPSPDPLSYESDADMFKFAMRCPRGGDNRGLGLRLW